MNAASWNFFKMLAGQARNFVISIILARLLLPEDFGLLGMAMIFVGFAESFVDFGFGNAVIQKQRVSRVQLSTVFWINMVMALFFAIVMFLTAPLVAMYFEMPQLKPITQLMSFTFIIKGLGTLQGALYKKKLDFKTPFKIDLISGLTSGAVGIYLAYAGYGVYSLIYSQILDWTLSTIMVWLFSSWKPSFMFQLASVKELWSFGYKYSLSTFLTSVFSKLDTIIIGKVFSAATLGLFYKAKSLNTIVVQYAFSSFAGVLFPSLSKFAQEKERLKNAMVRILHLVCFTTFLFSGLMYINAEAIIVLLYTEKWMGSVEIFKILGLFSFVFTIPTILVSPILSIGKSGAILKLEMIKKTLYLFAIPAALYYGLNAYLYATFVAAILGIYLNLRLTDRFLNLKIWDFLKLFFEYFSVFMIVLLIDHFFGKRDLNYILSILIKSSIYIAIYFGMNIFVFKSKGYEEFRIILVGLLTKMKILK